MIRRALLLATIAAAMGAPARAEASGVRRDVAATTVFTQYLWLEPNAQYSIETIDLSAGGDTVLYVVTDDGRGAPLAANDDCPGSGSLRSCVTVAPAASWRLVAVLVRSYSPSSIGAGTLKVCGNWCDWIWMTRYAGTTISAGESLGVNAKVMTVRQTQQPNEPVTATDTTVIARSSTAAVAGFDDEHGLRSTPETTRRMSRTTLPLACPSCQITVGVPQWAPEGKVTLMWDTGGADCDGDGWGDLLETAAGGHPCVRDWDNDGLDDGEEFYGVETAAESLQFPFWGANPAHKDVFLEADWVENLGSGGVDDFRLSENAALDLIARYQADPFNHAQNPDGRPGLQVHIDSGRPNRGSLFGNWGGANRLTAAMAVNNCAGLNSARNGYFRHAITHNGGGGNGGGRCYNAHFDSGWHNAHELGHTLGLSHGGTDAAVQANCKPSYKSIMNYAYFSDFSLGTFAGFRLNPTALDETNTFYTSDPAKIGYLEQPPWSFTLGRSNGVLDGNIDWNRDGLFEDAARGTPNFADVGGGCEFGMMHRTVMAGSFSEGFQTRMRNSLYWFAIASDGRMSWRKSGNLEDCNQQDTAASCPRDWTSSAWVPDGVGGQAMATGAAVAAPVDFPDFPITMIVYKRAADLQLVYQMLYDSPYQPQVEEWTPPQAFPFATGAMPANVTPSNAEPTMVSLEGTLYLYLPDPADQIHEYRFDVYQGWVDGGPAQYGDGAPLRVGTSPDGRGLGVVVGYEKDAATGVARRAIYGALRRVDGSAQMVRREQDGRWTALDGALAGSYRVKGVPRLGYLPFSSADPTAGRFYLLYRPEGSFNTRLAITEGNTTGAASARRMQFIRAATVLNAWGWGTSSYGLLSDGNGLRATFTQGSDLWYLPFVDGVYDADLRDEYDFWIMGQKVAL